MVDEVTQIGFAARLAFPVYKPRTFLSPGYQDNLGWGFATALGAQDARRDVPVVSISGDGGFMFTANEMATAIRHRIPLTAIVFNDGAFGNVRRIQQERFGNRLIASDLANPGLRRIRRELRRGRPSAPARRRNCALRCGRAFARRDGPTLIEVPVGPLPSPWEFIFMPPGPRPMRHEHRSDYLGLDDKPWRCRFSPLCKPRMELITTTERTGRRLRAPGASIPSSPSTPNSCARPPTTRCSAWRRWRARDEAVVVDALAPGIDLKPFFELMADERVLKVFHAARQDIEIVWHRAEASSRIRSSTPRSRPWCWATATRSPTTSWCSASPATRSTSRTASPTGRRRPLSPAQLTYAISDVTHLRDVYLALLADLGRRGRADWMDDEMEVLTSPDTYRAEPEQRLDAAQDPRAQAEGARGADRGRGLARARGADARRAALARAQGRRHRRHRGAGADHGGAARRRCARCPRASSARNGAKASSRRSSAGSRATRRRCRRSTAPKAAPNGAATVELLKVLLRMTVGASRRRRQGDRHGRRSRPHRRRRRGRRAGDEGLAARIVRREGAGAQARRAVACDPAQPRGRGRADA